jgi:hypothetical protein
MLKEEQRLRMSENRVLRRIFGSKTDEVAGGWRKLHSDWHHKLYASKSIAVKEYRERHVARMGTMRNTYKILVEKPEEERSFGVSRRALEDIIRLDLRETGLEGMDWIHLPQVRDQWLAPVIMVLNLQFT